MCLKRRWPHNGSRKRPIEDRFWEKTRRAEPKDADWGGVPCLLWTASVNGWNYGIIWYEGRMHVASRVVWILTNGSIPEGLCVLHRCDNAMCVEITHLWLGTHQDNQDDMIAKGRKRAACGEANGNYTHPESRPRGERHGMSKMTEGAKEDALRRHGVGESSYAIARIYGVHPTTIQRVIRREGYRARL